MFNETKHYGYVAPLYSGGWGNIIPGAYVRALSQEHGVLHIPGEHLAHLNIGDRIAIVPVHSCLTVNLMKRYLTSSGKWIETMESGTVSNMNL